MCLVVPFSYCKYIYKYNTNYKTHKKTLKKVASTTVKKN